MRFAPHYISRISKFVVSNAAGTVVDTIVLWLCATHLFQSYGYLGEYMISPLISFEFAVLTNYLCSWNFIWRDRSRQYRKASFVRKYILYNLSSSATFLAKMSILLLLERLFGWDVVICNLAALCISGCINFAIGEWVIFRRTKDYQ